MIPGIVSRLSESTVLGGPTIAPKTDLVNIANATEVTNIIPPFFGFSGVIFVKTSVAVAFTSNSTNNIGVTFTTGTNTVTPIFYSRAAGQWYPAQT